MEKHPWVQVRAGEFAGGAERDIEQHVFRAGPASTLVARAVHQCFQLHALPDIESADPFGRI